MKNERLQAQLAGFRISHVIATRLFEEDSFEGFGRYFLRLAEGWKRGKESLSVDSNDFYKFSPSCNPYFPFLDTFGRVKDWMDNYCADHGMTVEESFPFCAGIGYISMNPHLATLYDDVWTHLTTVTYWLDFEPEGFFEGEGDTYDHPGYEEFINLFSLDNCIIATKMNYPYFTIKNICYQVSDEFAGINIEPYVTIKATSEKKAEFTQHFSIDIPVDILDELTKE